MSKGVEEQQVGQDGCAGQPEVDELVRKVRGGDSRAFDDLVRVFQVAVFNLAYRMLNDYEEASDAAQEVFVKAYRGIRKFRGDSRFSTWLYSVAVNTCRSRLRSCRRERSMEGRSLDNSAAGDGSRGRREVPDPGAGPAEMAERGEMRELVEKSISELSPEFSSVMVMRDVEGLDYSEIAAALGCSLGTVKSRLWRARTMVKEKLQERLDGICGE